MHFQLYWKNLILWYLWQLWEKSKKVWKPGHKIWSWIRQAAENFLQVSDLAWYFYISILQKKYLSN